MRNVFENPVRYKRFIRSINATWDVAGVDFDKEFKVIGAKHVDSFQFHFFTIERWKVLTT